MFNLIQQNTGDFLFPGVTQTPLPQGTAGSVSAGTYFDLATEITTLSSAWNNWLINDSTPIEAPSLALENLSPAVCDTTNYPIVEQVAAGLGSIKLTKGSVSKIITLDFRNLGGSSSLAVTGFVANTIGAYALAIIEPMLIAGGDANLLSGGTNLGGGDWNFQAASYNAGCWAASFDFSGVAHFNNDRNNARKAGTLITEQHILLAHHYQIPIGKQVAFVGSDNIPVVRTVVGYAAGTVLGSSKTNPVPAIGDKAVAVLDSPVPATCTVYPVVGEWIYTETTDSMGRPSFVQAWVGVKLDYSRNVLLAGSSDTSAFYIADGGVNTYSYDGVGYIHYIWGVSSDWGYGPLPSFLSAYTARYLQSAVGDSGTPRFYPLTSTDLALVGCVTTSAGTCPFPHKDILDAMITTADADAIARANLVSPTGLTVTVAADPTL